MVRELYEDWRKVQDEISEAITRDRLGDKDVYSDYWAFNKTLEALYYMGKKLKDNNVLLTRLHEAVLGNDERFFRDISTTESIIELMMIQRLRDMEYAFVINIGSGNEIWPEKFNVTPQAEILTARKKYRADFLVEVVANDKEVNVVVECDGHDFHEKTKEQAARDKARDRDMQAAGYLVLRFTGSEIYKSVEMCAEQVEYAICRALGLDYRGRFFVPQEEPKSS